MTFILPPNMQRIFTNVKELHLEKLIPIEYADDSKKIKIGKIILENQDSNRRIIEKCDVRIYYQKYLLIEDTLLNSNKNYKNVYKFSIEKMKAEDRTIRKLLLLMFDKQECVFKVHKNSDEIQFKKSLIDMKLKEDLPNLDEYLYYRIFVESITFDQPFEPKLIKDYEQYIKKYVEEIRYLISVKYFGDAVSWCNNIMSKFFQMKKELKEKMTDEIFSILLKEIKPVFMNKTMALINKPSKPNNNDYREAIKVINEFFKYYTERDSSYLKMKKREIFAYMKSAENETAKEKLSELLVLYKDDPEINKLNEELNCLNKVKVKKVVKQRKILSYANVIDEFRWEVASETPNLKTGLSLLKIIN